MERAAGARRQQQGALLDIFLALVLGAGERLAGPPIVAHFVIVPLREDRHFGTEGEYVPVEQVVLVVAAELGKRLRHLRLFLGHDVFPDFPVRHFLLGVDRAVGINGIAVVNEEVGAVAQHGRIGAHAAARLVDAPALAGGVARPYERDRAPVARRGAKAAGHALADDGWEGKILKADPVEDVLPGGQTVDQRLGSEIGFGQRVDEDRALDGLETVRCRDLGQHARGTIGARPDHGGIGRDVTGLDAMGNKRAISGAAQIRFGEAAHRGDRGRGRGRGQKPPPRHGNADRHGKFSGCKKKARDGGPLSRNADGYVTLRIMHCPGAVQIAQRRLLPRVLRRQCRLSE
jgi:hypothetical protein